MYHSSYLGDYPITLNMRPKLLLSRQDRDIEAYLRELKAPVLDIKAE